jgi:hypothetical protein
MAGRPSPCLLAQPRHLGSRNADLAPRSSSYAVSSSILYSTLTSDTDEVRIRYVQTSSRAEALLNKIRDTLQSGVEIAEEKVGEILSILGGAGEDGKAEARKASADAAKTASKAASSAESVAHSLSAEAVKASKKVCGARRSSVR